MWNFRAALEWLSKNTRDKRAAAAREESGLWYRSIFDNAMEAVLLTTSEGAVVMANRACAEMFGYTEQELRALGRSAVVDDTDPRLPLALEQRARTGRFRGELTMKRKDGTRIEVEVSSVVFGDERRANWTSMFIRDISERKAQEAERERLLSEIESEHRWLRAVLEHVPLGVFLFEPSGRMYFNAKTEEMVGRKLSPQGGSAQYVHQLRFPDGSPVSQRDLLSTQVLSTGEVITGVEFLIERDDGSRLPVLASAAPIRDGGGKVIGGIAVLQDLSEHVRKEEAIRANERLLNGIFELLPVGVWIADENARIVRGNAAGLRIWGGARYVDPAQFREYRGWWADSGKLIEPDEWALSRALQRGETSLGEVIRIQCFDGTYKTIINSALPLYDSRGKFAGAIAVNEDITLLKETEADLQRAVEARDRVLSIVAHDLRSPLNVVQMQLHFLAALKERRTDHVEALRIIQKQIDGMARLVHDLLDVTRIEQGTLELQQSPVSCEALLKEVVAAHEHIARACSLVLVCDVHSDICEINADRGRIVQVLNNLIGNALKFTPPGGRITVGADSRRGEALIWVTDTGAGIPPESLEHVFDALWQSSADRRGVGLGLTIAKSIVEAHGGRIWAESTVGRGSTFFFTVPAASSLERRAASDALGGRGGATDELSPPFTAAKGAASDEGSQ